MIKKLSGDEKREILNDILANTLLAQGVFGEGLGIDSVIEGTDFNSNSGNESAAKTLEKQ